MNSDKIHVVDVPVFRHDVIKGLDPDTRYIELRNSVDSVDEDDQQFRTLFVLTPTADGHQVSHLCQVEVSAGVPDMSAPVMMNDDISEEPAALILSEVSRLLGTVVDEQTLETSEGLWAAIAKIVLQDKDLVAQYPAIVCSGWAADICSNIFDVVSARSFN